MRETTCVECGQRVVVPATSGPLPSRCAPCTTSRNKELEKARAQARKQRRGASPRQTFACADCQTPLEWAGSGRPKVRCVPCASTRNREEGKKRTVAWALANPERVREYQRRGYQRNVTTIRARKLDQHYRRKYGITRADRDRMVAEQGGVCKICKGHPDPRHKGSRLHVDHCHTTGRVRGLLCGNCNTAIGLFKENPLFLAAAAAYLAEQPDR